MRRYRFDQLPKPTGNHFASGIVPGKRIAGGGLNFHAKGQRTHAAEERHVHEHEEVFFFVQGKAVLELDAQRVPVQAGDVIVIEPWENHHIVADAENPTINFHFICDDAGNPKQYGDPASAGEAVKQTGYQA